MTFPEDVTVAALLLVGIITTVSLYAGLIGMVVGGGMGWCRSCRHVAWSNASAPGRCPRCHHAMAEGRRHAQR